LDMIAEEGLEQIWDRHRVFAEAVRAAVNAWSSPDGIDFNILDPAHRSNSTTTVVSGTIDSERLRAVLQCATLRRILREKVPQCLFCVDDESNSQ
ncbi:MAG: hypothetical protein AAF420_05495, partial [Pseudomonadota bacterium]